MYTCIYTHINLLPLIYIETNQTKDPDIWNDGTYTLKFNMFLNIFNVQHSFIRFFPHWLFCIIEKGPNLLLYMLYNKIYRFFRSKNYVSMKWGAIALFSSTLCTLGYIFFTILVCLFYIYTM